MKNDPMKTLKSILPGKNRPPMPEPDVQVNLPFDPKKKPQAIKDFERRVR